MAEVQRIKPPVVRDIYDISDDALSQIRTWIEQAGLRIPVSQIVGTATVPQSPTVQDVVNALKSLGIISQ
jgi:hypothetical protein